MNRIYKVIFNRRLGLWQVCSEHARGQSKCSANTISRTVLALACALLLPAPTLATDLLVGSGGNGGGADGLGGAGSSTSGGGGGIGRNSGVGIGGGGGGGGIGGGGGGGTFATNLSGGAGGGSVASGGIGAGSGGAGGAYVLGIAHGSAGGSGSGGGGGGGAGGNGVGGGGGSAGIGGGGGAGGADFLEIGAGGGGGGGGGIGGGGGGGGAGAASGGASNGGNGGSADAIINSGPTATVSSNTTYRLVGIGGGGGGGGGGQAGGNGLDGTLTIDNATLTVSQSLLVGGGGGGGGSGSGGNGGNGALVLTNGAGLSVARTLLIGGNSGAAGGAGDGGAGGSGTVSSAAGTTISIGIGFLYLGANAAGVLNLGGALSFSGGVSLIINSTGTLNFGNATANAAGAGAIIGTNNLINNGAINFNQSNASYVFSPAISGSGSVTHNSSGTTILTGNSSYSGGTTINAGTLQIGNGGTSGSIAGNVANNGTLTFNRSDALTYAGNVSGTGALTQSGAGTLTLTGSNSYTGGTTVSAGTLAGNSASLQGNITNNNAVTFDQAAAGSYAGVMSGTGSLSKSGAGTLTLTGANTHSGGTTVNAGTLAVSTSSLLGTGTLNIGSAGAVSINAGAGSLALGGAGNPGALVLNGTLNAAGISVGNSGTLGGSGSFAGNANIGAGGIFAPGNSIGTMTVANVSFASGSIYRVEANAAGQADRINATGTATLGGGTVDVQAAAGVYQRNTTYTILNAAGGVTGTFTNVTSNLAFLTPALTYDANNVQLTLTRNDVQLNAIAATANQQVFSTYLDSLGNLPALQSLLARIDGLSAEQARAAFISLGGNTLTAGGTMSLQQSAGFIQLIGNRLQNPGAGSGLAFSGLKLAAANTMSDAPAVYAQAGVPSAPRSAATGRGFWIQGGAARGNMDGNGNATGFDWRGTQFTMGADTELEAGTVLGAALGYGRGTASPDAGGSTKTKSPRVSVYGSHDLGAWTFSGSAGYARPEFDVQRLVTVGASTTIASSSYRGDEWSAAAEAQYTLQFNGFQLKPLAGVRYVQLKQDGYTETGSLANLTVGAQRTESTVSLIGARYQRPVHDGRGTFEARAIWSHEFGDNSPSLNGRLAAVPGGTTFTVNGVPLKRDALTLGLGIASQVNKRLSLHLDGNVELRGSGQQQQALVAGLRYAW